MRTLSYFCWILIGVASLTVPAGGGGCGGGNSPPPSEDRKWQTVETIDGSSQPAGPPSIAFLSGGKALAAWAQGSSTPTPALITRICDPATKLWGSLTIQGNGTANDVVLPRVAADGADRAFVVWRQKNASAEGASNVTIFDNNASHYTPPLRLDTAAEPVLEGPEVASGPGGFTFVAWIQQAALASDHNVWANFFNPALGPGGSWAGAQVLDNLSATAQGIGVGSNGGGSAVAAWVQNGDLYTNRFDLLAGGWQGPEVMEPYAGPAFNPAIVMDEDGNATLVWMQNDGTEQRVRARRFEPATGWQAERLLDPGTDSPGFPIRVASGPDGGAFALWATETAGPSKQLWAARFLPGTGWEVAVRLAAPPAGIVGVAGLALAVSPSGHALAIWSPIDAALNGDTFSYRYVSGEGWGTEVPIEDAGAPTVIGAAAFDFLEDAIAVFQVDPAGAGDIAANRFE
ncbi:MAG TPA: hypothetical protein VLJ37_12870 [bacterium]|nr:hypothetical protein [bacterium]